MSSSEDRDIHWHPSDVWFVETNALKKESKDESLIMKSDLKEFLLLFAAKYSYRT